jgi:hypothetical protein
MVLNWDEALAVASKKGKYIHNKLNIEVDNSSYPIKVCLLDHQGNITSKFCYKYKQDILRYLNTNYIFFTYEQ